MIFIKVKTKDLELKIKILSLTDEAGLHPALHGFKELYDDGSLGIMNSVGYPNPDRSHFRSMDIWHTAVKAKSIGQQVGWVVILMHNAKDVIKPTYALELDDTLSLAMKGEEAKAIAMKDPKAIIWYSQSAFF
jgi:uncharacterized protein (DUF1501 family)